MGASSDEWDKLVFEAQAQREPSWPPRNILAERLIPRFDPVDKPEHYGLGKVECIEAIKASMSAEEYKGYLKGNTIKYLWRYQYKGKPVQDLKKAQWYLNKLIEANA
jgi:hypothetical protein